MNFNEALIKINQIPYAGSVLSWILFGFAAALTAKIILPGKEHLGWIRTILVGILGAFIGGIGAAKAGINIHMGWNLMGFGAAVAGTIVCLIINRVVTQS